KYIENKNSVGLKNFWEAIEASPRDLIGDVHMNLVIKCLDESKADDKVPLLKEQLLKVKEWLWVKYNRNHLQKRLEISPYTRKSKIAFSAFIERLSDKESYVRSSAAEALGNLGSDAPEVINALTALLSDKDWQVRSSAAEALGKLGSAAPEVINALTALL